jgi:stage V sporulation protein D (sporulation-specific penicillin-binding protein)
MDKSKLKRKFIVIFGILVLLFSVITGRLMYIMIVKAPEYKKDAIKQWDTQITIPAKRGSILDRNGNDLAVSAEAYRVDVDMNTLRQTLMLKKKTIDDIIPELASALNMDKDKLTKILESTSPNGVPLKFITLARQIEKATADNVNNLNIRGIVTSSDPKRYYPNNAFLANVLGSTNYAGNGVEGVELSYNKELSGTAGSELFQSDNMNRQLPDGDFKYTAPVNGEDVTLTIDETIQEYAEQAAEKALKDNKAKAVSITVMNPNNGEILAMVNKPDYNPNTPTTGAKEFNSIQEMWKNSAVENAFEPGSIFKVITATAAMEVDKSNGNKNLENATFVDPGSIKVADRTIHCWLLSGHGVENFVDIIKNSCNVGFVELGQMIGKENLNFYINKFKFGQKTGIDLPDESSGIIKSTKDMGPVDLATISFGQGDAVTAVQYMAAFNAVANGGTWIRPHIMKQLSHKDSNGKVIVDKQFDNFGKDKILDTDITSTLRGYLEKVVTEGVGMGAYVPGLYIGGKTGTAQKSDPKTGGYYANKYMSSFAGMAPVSNPKITLLVSIDEPDPSNYYAGQTAAPVAKDLFTNIFNYLILKGDISQSDLK